MTPAELRKYANTRDREEFWARPYGPLAPAMRMAQLYHLNQLYGEEKYIAHLDHVLITLSLLEDPAGLIDEEYYVLALLHDCYEDAKEKFPDMLLTIEICYGRGMVDNVLLISREKDQSRSDYYTRMGNARNEIVATVKACDRYANCTYGSLVPTPKQKKYWEEYPELRSAIADCALPDSVAILDDWYFSFLKATRSKA